MTYCLPQIYAEHIAVKSESIDGTPHVAALVLLIRCPPRPCLFVCSNVPMLKQTTLLLLVCSCLIACNQPAAESTSEVAYPELLDRSEAIRNGTEWDRVQNNYVAARNTLLEDSTDVDARLAMARVFVLEARITGEHGHYYPGALEVLEGALRQNDLTPDQRYQALTLLASVQLSQHEFADALKTSQQAIRLNPYAAVGYGALVDAYVELGQYDKAVAAADKMIQVKPDLRSYARVSYLREIHGKVDDALQSMRLALDAGYPGTEETSWVRLTLGDILKQYGRVAEAEDQYEMALEDRPNYPFAKAALADIAAEKGDYATAEQLLTEAIAAIPEVGFYEQRVHLYRATDRPKLADETLEEVLEMLQDDVDHGHNMNMEYADVHTNLTGDLDMALDYAMREYDKRPDNIDVNRVLSSIYYLRGNYDASAKHAEKASVTDSQHPELQLVRGMLAIQRGDDKTGREQIAAAQALQPNPPAALAKALQQVQG